MSATTTFLEPTTSAAAAASSLLSINAIVNSSIEAAKAGIKQAEAEQAENSNNHGRFLSMASNIFKSEKFSHLRPLNEFFDKNRFNCTTITFELVRQRWNYNLQYFSSNYFVIMLCLATYSVLTNWWLLFTMVFLFGGFYLLSKIDEPIKGLSNTKLYATYALASCVLLFISGATSAIFWVIGAGAAIILSHAALLEPGIEGDFAEV